MWVPFIFRSTTESMHGTQVEHYFSDANLPTDAFLLQQVAKHPEGYVPLAVIMSFKKMRRYGKDPAVVAAALRSSELLEVSLSGKAVRRREPLKAVDHSELRSRTLLITGLPDKSSIEELEGRCRPYGTLGFVKIRKPEVLDPLIAFNPRFMTWVGHRWYGLVEYSSSEEAHRARAALDSTDSWRGGQRAAILNVLPQGKAARPPKQAGPDRQGAGASGIGGAAAGPSVGATDDAVQECEAQAPDGGREGQPPGGPKAKAKPARRDYSAWASASHASPGAGAGAREGPRQPRMAVPGEKGFGMGRGKPLPVPA
ncbi:La-related protein 7 [Auxenochlorella protothecoides]|uniref:La-related protein 7 n=1 Tax=Auxenochlorella protothecoides TaxID=3075 RepID=A0A087SGF0_AUXPR|nr:La-related protein 7 [Auxenochlorella protothecoides]KFM24804.1 La-related protein 7 [Auxenochlorella protothecoides]